MPSAAEPVLEHSPQEAARFLALLDEQADAFAFRVFDDNEARKNPALAAKFTGTLAEVTPQLLAAQAKGCGVYVVANAGAQTNDTIYKVRAVFADTDGADLGPILACGLEPHIVVESSPGKWHVYWLVDGLPTEAFRDIQRNIAARFGTDKSVNDLARVMRLPGFVHQKGQPFLVRIIHESGGLPYEAATILEHFGGAPAESVHSAAPALGQPVLADRHADVLKCTLLLAAAVRAGGITHAEAFALMQQRRDQGRWSRHVPDDEIARALEGALEKGGAAILPAQEPTSGPLFTLDGFTEDELEAAAIQHPHAFMGDDESGLFPAGEVTVIGAPGREGKTTLIMAIARHYALGEPIAGMVPAEIRSVVIYSAEDDRAQYARKTAAQAETLPTADRKRFRENVRVPDLYTPEVEHWRDIVTMEGRVPKQGPAVDGLIEAIERAQTTACPPGLVIFETASTLSAAEEDNPGHRTMIAALKRVAKRTGVACVLVHHTSQNAATHLPDLNISEADIRGGTTLVANARQTHLIVNLGSTEEPFPEADARTVLRGIVAPGINERVVAMVCLSSSKCADPVPLFFRWETSQRFGPRMGLLMPPVDVRGKRWRRLHRMLSGAKAAAKADKKAETGQANIRMVVRAAAELCERGEAPTITKLSAACGFASPRWAKPYADAAVELGELVRTTEKLPRAPGMTDVFRVPEGVKKPWDTDSGAESSP